MLYGSLVLYIFSTGNHFDETLAPVNVVLGVIVDGKFILFKKKRLSSDNYFNQTAFSVSLIKELSNILATK